jgi:hypothetical protein
MQFGLLVATIVIVAMCWILYFATHSAIAASTRIDHIHYPLREIDDTHFKIAHVAHRFFGAAGMNDTKGLADLSGLFEKSRAVDNLTMGLAELPGFMPEVAQVCAFLDKIRHAGASGGYVT